jgi:hypothetical protein
VRSRLAHPGATKPVVVEVLTYAPTIFYHCQHCELTFDQVGLGGSVHRQQLREALPPELSEQWHAISDWAEDVATTYGDSVVVKIVDAASLEGIWKSLRHRVYRYPTIVVGGQQRHTTQDRLSIGW